MASLSEIWSRFDAGNELHKRILTGTVLAFSVLILLLLGGPFFAGLILLCAMLMIQEWNELTQNESRRFQLAGYAYVLLPCLSLLMLRTLVFPDFAELEAETSPLPVLHLLCIVIATDVGAFAAGRILGRHKIAPAISPSKTWEGLAGGVLAAGIISMSFAPFLVFPTSTLSALLLGVVLAIISQTGDFFESWLKRRAGVKDSGHLLPGHGGILDRVDGLTFAAPFYLFTAILGGGISLT
ncbi:MAG: phosphatidate cytidylyltransferase [Rickettsiales bacterium]|nr:phosphatidate cytidylyltransferase [Rickettsiales bacterium]